MTEMNSNQTTELLIGVATGHPLGMGIGAVIGGSTACATAAVLAGPLGAVAGAIVGIVAGGLGGRAIAEVIEPHALNDPSVEPCPMTSSSPHKTMTWPSGRETTNPGERDGSFEPPLSDSDRLTFPK